MESLGYLTPIPLVIIKAVPPESFQKLKEERPEVEEVVSEESEDEVSDPMPKHFEDINRPSLSRSGSSASLESTGLSFDQRPPSACTDASDTSVNADLQSTTTTGGPTPLPLPAAPAIAPLVPPTVAPPPVPPAIAPPTLPEIDESNFDVATLTCKLCNKTMKNMRTFKNHRARHLGTLNHKCPDCSKSFEGRSAVNRHLISNHNRELLSHEITNNPAAAGTNLCRPTTGVKIFKPSEMARKPFTPTDTAEQAIERSTPEPRPPSLALQKEEAKDQLFDMVREGRAPVHQTPVVGQMPILLENPVPQPVKYIVGSQLKVDEDNIAAETSKETAKEEEKKEEDEKESKSSEELTSTSQIEEDKNEVEGEGEAIKTQFDDASSADSTILESATKSDAVIETETNGESKSSTEKDAGEDINDQQSQMDVNAQDENKLEDKPADTEETSTIKPNVEQKDQPKALPPEIANMEKIIPESDSDSDSDSSSSSSSSDSDSSSDDDSDSNEPPEQPEEILIEDDEPPPATSAEPVAEPVKASSGQSPTKESYLESFKSFVDSSNAAQEANTDVVIVPSAAMPTESEEDRLSAAEPAEEINKVVETSDVEETSPKKKREPSPNKKPQTKQQQDKPAGGQPGKEERAPRAKQAVAKNKVSMVARIFKAKKREEPKYEEKKHGAVANSKKSREVSGQDVSDDESGRNDSDSNVDSAGDTEAQEEADKLLEKKGVSVVGGKLMIPADKLKIPDELCKIKLVGRTNKRHFSCEICEKSYNRADKIKYHLYNDHYEDFIRCSDSVPKILKKKLASMEPKLTAPSPVAKKPLPKEKVVISKPSALARIFKKKESNKESLLRKPRLPRNLPPQPNLEKDDLEPKESSTGSDKKRTSRSPAKSSETEPRKSPRSSKSPQVVDKVVSEVNVSNFLENDGDGKNDDAQDTVAKANLPSEARSEEADLEESSIKFPLEPVASETETSPKKKRGRKKKSETEAEKNSSLAEDGDSPAYHAPFEDFDIGKITPSTRRTRAMLEEDLTPPEIVSNSSIRVEKVDKSLQSCLKGQSSARPTNLKVTFDLPDPVYDAEGKEVVKERKKLVESLPTRFPKQQEELPNFGMNKDFVTFADLALQTKCEVERLQKKESERQFPLRKKISARLSVEQSNIEDTPQLQASAKTIDPTMEHESDTELKSEDLKPPLKILEVSENLSVVPESVEGTKGSEMSDDDEEISDDLPESLKVLLGESSSAKEDESRPTRSRLHVDTIGLNSSTLDMELHALRNLVFNEILKEKYDNGENNLEPEEDKTLEKEQDPVAKHKDVTNVIAEQIHETSVEPPLDAVGEESGPEPHEKMSRVDRFILLGKAFSKTLPRFRSQIWHQRKKLRKRKSSEYRALLSNVSKEKQRTYKPKRYDYSLDILCRNNLYDNLVFNSNQMMETHADLTQRFMRRKPFDPVVGRKYAVSQKSCDLKIVLEKKKRPEFSCLVNAVDLKLNLKKCTVAPAQEVAKPDNDQVSTAAKKNEEKLRVTNPPIAKKRGRKPKQAVLEKSKTPGRTREEGQSLLDSKVSEATVPETSTKSKRERKPDNHSPEHSPAVPRKKGRPKKVLEPEKKASVQVSSSSPEPVLSSHVADDECRPKKRGRKRKVNSDQLNDKILIKKCKFSGNISSEEEQQVPLKITFKRPPNKEDGSRKEAIQLRVKTQTTSDHGFNIQIHQPNTDNPVKFRLRASGGDVKRSRKKSLEDIADKLAVLSQKKSMSDGPAAPTPASLTKPGSSSEKSLDKPKVDSTKEVVESAEKVLLPRVAEQGIEETKSVAGEAGMSSSKAVSSENDSGVAPPVEAAEESRQTFSGKKLILQQQK